MTTLVFLFLLGLFMLSLEIFLPGGVLGVLGGLVLIGAVVLAFRDHGSLGGMIALTVSVVLGTATVVTEFVLLPKTRFGQRLYLSASVTGVATHADDPKVVIGRACEAATVLAPSGVVLLDGRQHEAFCQDGFADRGAKLVVRGADNFRLIVSKS